MEPPLNVMSDTLSRSVEVIYDLGHMLPSPYNYLRAAAYQRFDMKQGNVIFRQGHATFGLFVVISGCVHLERVAPNGDRIVIHRAMDGAPFAEASIFSETYHCDALVVQSGVAFRIDKAAVLEAFTDPDFARAYGRQATKQVQLQRQILEIVAIKSAEERVLAGLTAGLLRGTVTDFAAQIQLTHEATYRALRRLVLAGRVENSGRGKYALAASP